MSSALPGSVSPRFVVGFRLTADKSKSISGTVAWSVLAVSRCACSSGRAPISAVAGCFLPMTVGRDSASAAVCAVGIFVDGGMFKSRSGIATALAVGCRAGAIDGIAMSRSARAGGSVRPTCGVVGRKPKSTSATVGGEWLAAGGVQANFDADEGTCQAAILVESAEGYVWETLDPPGGTNAILTMTAGIVGEDAGL